MSRLILLILGFIAGWFLKDSDWQRPSGDTKTHQQAPSKPISLVDEEPAPEANEVFADSLEDLPSIGPASKAKLNENGIYTFAQTAALTPEKLKEIAGGRVKVEAVIAQAKELAG